MEKSPMVIEMSIKSESSKSFKMDGGQKTIGNRVLAGDELENSGSLWALIQEVSGDRMEFV
jgi:hypothetical protein